MPLATATVAFNLSDQLGVDFDDRRTKVWITTNILGETVIDTDGNAIRLGSGNVTVNADGTGSFTTWVPGVGSNPVTWQTYVHVNYPDRNAPKGRSTRTFGPFTITAEATARTVSNKALTTNVATITTSVAHDLAVGNTITIAGVDATFNGTYTIAAVPSTTTLSYAKTAADVASVAATGTLTSPNVNLADLVLEQEIPPEYLTTVTALLDGYVTEAEVAQFSASASAAAAAASAALADSYIITDLGTSDGQVEALVESPSSLSRKALDAAYVASALTPNLEFATVPLSAEATVGANPVPIDAFDGYVYGFMSNGLYRTTDPVGSWTLVKGFASVTDGGTADIVGVRKLGNGEVLVIKMSAGLFVSSGWATNPLTATFTRTLAPTTSAGGSSWFLNFGVDVNATLGWVTATTYQAGHADYAASRYAWLSKNNGATWTVIFDYQTKYPAIDPNFKHMHATAIEYRPGSLAVPRIWVSGHQIEGSPTTPGSDEFVVVSENEGTTWTEVATDGTPGADVKPTIIRQAKAGMVMASDNYPNGILHSAFRTSIADLRIKMGLQIRRDVGSLIGWGSKVVVDTDGTAYLTFENTASGMNAPVVASDGSTSSEFATIVAGTGVTIDAQQIMFVGTRILVGFKRAGVSKYLYLDKPARAALTVGRADSGGVLSGEAYDGSIAVGLGSSAPAYGSVALGVGAVIGNTYATAVGWRAKQITPGSFGTAIGCEAEAVSGVAIGYRAKSAGSGTALGREAEAITSNVIAVGQGAKVLGSAQRTIVMGQLVVVTNYNDVTAIGHATVVSATGATAIGSGAQTASGVAVGFGAIALGATSTAVGRSATGGSSVNATVVGQAATVTAGSGTAVGAAATTAQGTALGAASQALGTRTTALGRDSVAGASHSNSVALGDGVVTTAANQVHVGPRHFGIAESATEPAASAADSLRLYAVDDGAGNTQLRVRFNGTTKIIRLGSQFGTNGLGPSQIGYTTATRPGAATAGAGAQYFDTTLAKPGYSDGTVWRDAAGTAI